MVRRIAQSFKDGIRLEIAGLVGSAFLLIWAALASREGGSTSVAVIAGLAGIATLSLTIGYYFRQYERRTSRRSSAEKQELGEDDDTAERTPEPGESPEPAEPSAAETGQTEGEKAREEAPPPDLSAVETAIDRLREELVAVFEAKTNEILEAITPPEPAAAPPEKPEPPKKKKKKRKTAKKKVKKG